MEKINLYAAWIGILLGFIAGAIPGLFFHQHGWLRGYTSWKRRMIRLAHISFFGLAFINLTFVLTVSYLGLHDKAIIVPSRLLVAGAILMPAVCYVSLSKREARYFFLLPVLCLVVGTTWLIFGGLFS